MAVMPLRGASLIAVAAGMAFAGEGIAQIATDGTLGPAGALSGPLARGDAGVLVRHLQALDGDAAVPLYRELMRTLLVLAEQRLPPERLQGLRDLLADDHSPR